MPQSNLAVQLSPVHKAIEQCKLTFWITFWFTFVINLLMLLTPLYSLQVLDRVIGSGSLETLLMLSLIIGIIYFVYGLLQTIRGFTLIKIGEWLDNNLSPTIFAHGISATASSSGTGATQMLRDFQAVKLFLTSSGINALYDMPWSLIYVIVIFLIHPYLGTLTVVGGIVIISLALFNAVVTNKTLGEATELSIKGYMQAEIASRNAETVEAMGMMQNITKNWRKFNQASLNKQSYASYRNSIISNFSRFIRNVMQMMVTGIGAYIVVTTDGQDMTTGGMIASSIIVGRALAPFDNAIELWKSMSSAFRSYKNINQAFAKYTPRNEAMPIPGVTGHLAVEDLYYAIPTPAGKPQPLNPKYILQGVSFQAYPGEILAIIGSSAAGKSTLAKILVGVWKASGGAVRLDGGEIYQWNRQDFGQHVGYLPQGVELFSGNLKQNIARMAEEAEPDQVIKAAQLAGAHEMIMRLPSGYDTDIGPAGSNLSGGQRQRVGLARSFYGSPKMLILDEPNANLDQAGEAALAEALIQAKNLKMTVIVISHRPSILSIVDKILVLQNGTVKAYGTQSEVQAKVSTAPNYIASVK